MIAEMTDERLAWHMENWSRLVLNDAEEIAEMSFPAHSTVFINGTTHSDESNEVAQQEADKRDAVAINAIIESIDGYLQAVIYNYWGFQLWTKQPKETDYPDACAAVKALAMKRGLV
jgi:hypothetical protein